jgi:hypothetical protein
MKKTHLILALALVGVLALSVGCRRVDLREEGDRTTERVTAKGAERVEAEIHMGPGNLEIAGGARGFMEGEFQYSDSRLAPEIDYRVDGDVGELDMRQGESGNWFPRFWGGTYRNAWDVQFSDRTPFDLRVNLGAGDAELDLGGTMLEELRMETGAGSIDVDVAGSDSLDELRISTGAGDLNVDVSGGSALRRFGFETGAGSLRLDLTGDDWTEDIEGRIDGGAGDVRISLPSEIPVEVEVEHGIGEVTADGLMSDGDTWVNEAYGEPGPVMRIRITQGVGSVRLQAQ